MSYTMYLECPRVECRYVNSFVVEFGNEPPNKCAGCGHKLRRTTASRPSPDGER